MGNFERKVLVVLSGGLDSCVLLADYLNEGYKAECITFDYGSKHGLKERASARKIAAHYKVAQREFKLDLNTLNLGSALLLNDSEIPNGHYAEETMKKTIVPFRNGIMLSIASAYADSRNIPFLGIGAHAGDHFIYPDCRIEFLKAMSVAIANGTSQGITLSAPFSKKSKAEIVRLGNSLRVPFEKTWTCYKGNDIHCGICGSCTERKEAFFINKLPDPTTYKE